MAGPRVVVIGAGIIGASLAYYLTKQGAAVTILDSAEPGGLATRASFAWINASWGNPEFYFRFRRFSMQEWRRLDREVPGLHLNWCGGLCWDLPRDKLEAYAEEHDRWGYGIKRVNRAQAQRIEPNLANPPEFALYVAEEGAVEPAETAQKLLAAAQVQGAEMFPHTRVKWLIRHSERITGVMTQEGELHADCVALAAGAGVAQLAASVDVPIALKTPPGLLVHTKPAGEMLHGLVIAPELHVRQTAEGRLVAGSDFSGADPGENPGETAQALFTKLQAMIEGGDRLELDFHTVGYRPTPEDGLPLIGRPEGVDGLYITVMHSGITNAAATGALASVEIVADTNSELLNPFRPQRFQSQAPVA